MEIIVVHRLIFLAVKQVMRLRSVKDILCAGGNLQTTHKTPLFHAL